jgi:prevent-host-death family protein
MSSLAPESHVVSVADARIGLSQTLKRFRQGEREPVIVGSHRKPEAVILPVDDYFATGNPEVQGVNLDRLRELSSVIRALASAHHLRDVAVFGSVARGEQTSASDVDLLVSSDGKASLFDIAGFELDMETILMRPVHAVSRGGLDEVRDAHILGEAVSL